MSAPSRLVRTGYSGSGSFRGDLPLSCARKAAGIARRHEGTRVVTRTTWLCRRCLTRYQGDPSGLDPESELHRRIAAPTKAARIGVHSCAPGAWGVSDLVGALSEPMTTEQFAKTLEQDE